MNHFLKSLLNSLQFFFLFWLEHESLWDLSSSPGIRTTTPCIKGEVLTTGQPGKSLLMCVYFFFNSFLCIQEFY